MFKKAEKAQTKARIALAGPSGAGKTKSALLLAFGLVGHNGKIAVLDTEHGTAKLYSSLGDYDVKEMGKPYTTGKYLSVIESAEELNYNVLIIDSFSHAWAGEGGILEQVDKLSSKGNKSEAWSMVQPQHYELVERMLKSNLHIIITMRTKTEYFVTDVNGRLSPKKVGMAPVQREGVDYDFNLVFDLDQPSHVALASKDRTGLFDQFAGVLTEEHGKAIRSWLDDGVQPATSSAPVEAEQGTASQPEPPAAGGATQLFINGDQVKQLKKLLAETGADSERFLAHFGAEKLERLAAAKFDTAVTMLETKKSQMEQGQPNDSRKMAETLKARNIPFTEESGMLLANPAFKDSSSQAFLKELGFKWDGKLKGWKLAA